jgi:hypothetical protein
MFTVYLVCDETPRIKLGRYAVKSHHDANDRARKQHERIFVKLATGQWKVETLDEQTGEVQVWGTV